MEIRRLLLATDFSDLSVNAAAFARSLAIHYNAMLHVLHVREPQITAAPMPGLDSGVMTAAPDEEELRRKLNLFVAAHCAEIRLPVLAAVITGTAVNAITTYAHEHAIELIIIGTHARGIMKRLLHGSVSKGVLENAGCAVLMVPRAATAAGEQAALTAEPAEPV